MDEMQRHLLYRKLPEGGKDGLSKCTIQTKKVTAASPWWTKLRMIPFEKEEKFPFPPGVWTGKS